MIFLEDEENEGITVTLDKNKTYVGYDIFVNGDIVGTAFKTAYVDPTGREYVIEMKSGNFANGFWFKKPKNIIEYFLQYYDPLTNDYIKS